MRFMVIVKASRESEAGMMPDRKILEEMGQYNEKLARAGMLLAAEGLHPSSKGKRVRFSGPDPIVIDGPFPETKDLVAGFWLLQARSMDELLAWVKRAPFGGGVEVEVRPVFETADFGETMTPEMRRHEEALREMVGKR